MDASNRLAIVFDYAEEHWPSMDRCGRMLLGELHAHPEFALNAHEVRANFRHRFSRLPLLGARGAARNADRLINRFRDYPRYLRRRVGEFDLFHICDHSYSQLVHALPADRTGVFCHDLDTFRCLLDPGAEPRPRWFRAMARRILDGFQKAAVVFYSTAAVRKQIERHGLIESTKLVQASLGVSPEFFTPSEDGRPPHKKPYLLHVGSCIPRKRIDVLLDVVGRLRSRRPDLRVIQVGGEWTADQREQIVRLGIADSIEQLRGISNDRLASLYRNSAAVLQTSEAEGFGLPVIEALAAGAIVIASDIPVLREVGGDGVIYSPVGDVAAWTDTVSAALDGRDVPSREIRFAQASKFSWTVHARTIADAYRRLPVLNRASTTQ